MTNISTPIVFFGTEDFSLASLRALVEAEFSVVLVVTKPDSKQGRGHKLSEPAVKTYATAHNIPVLQPRNMTEIIDTVSVIDQPTGVLVSYGKIIPQSIIDLFTPGIINVHPSLLPRYRGPSPIESAILHGDRETGISIMQLSAKMDAGPVYHQITFPLTGTETSPELYDTLGQRGADELTQTLPAIIDGSLQATLQDDMTASYCSLISKADGIIDWHLPATQIERTIRAYADWPQSRTTIAGIDCIITAATVAHTPQTAPGSVTIDGTTLLIGTGDGQLIIDALKPIGKKEMPVQAFLAGYQSQFQM